MKSVLGNARTINQSNCPKLEFAISFGSGVTLGSWTRTAANTYSRTVTGVDSSTGFDMADVTNFFGAGAVLNIYALPEFDVDTECVTQIRAATYPNLPGIPRGAQELYSYVSSVITSTPGDFKPQQAMQILRADFTTDIERVFTRKFFITPANLRDRLHHDVSSGSFLVLEDRKTGGFAGSKFNGDYRVAVSAIEESAGSILLIAKGDAQANGTSTAVNTAESFWSQITYQSQYYLKENYPYWLEVFVKRPQKINERESFVVSPATTPAFKQDITTGRTVVVLVDALTGERITLADKQGGRQMGAENLPWTRFFPTIMYTGGWRSATPPSVPMAHTAIEFWDNMPNYVGKIEARNHGPLPWVPTPLSKATMFGASNGNDANPGTELLPKTYQGAVNAAVNPGDVVFFRGGTLALTTAAHFSLWNAGTAANPIIYEVYPGEVFTIDGSAITPGVGNQRRVNYSDSFQKLRGVRIINMPEYGIYNSGLDNMVDGCEIAYCNLSGVSNTGSRMTVMNSWIHHCSDVGKFGGNYNDGGNADGISFSSGTGGSILHNLITDCSDDLIDTWQSLHTTVKYNICIRAGAGNGNGNGIKGGGGGVGAYAIIDHNLVWDCLNNGIDVNTGIGVSVNSNTTGSCGGVGYVFEADTTHSRNVSIGDGSTHTGTGIPGLPNSWDIAGTPVFLNTDPTSVDFLKVTQDGIFDGIGAHYV